MGLGVSGDAVVTRRTRARGRDAGVTVMELVVGMAVAMIAFAMLASVLITAQRQEKLTTETARSFDEVRLALARVTNEIREARGLTQSGADAQAWFDLDHDAVQDAGEVHVLGFRTVGGVTRLVREINGTSETLVDAIASGTLTVTLEKTGLQLAISVTMPDNDAGGGGATLTSKVVTRGNF